MLSKQEYREAGQESSHMGGQRFYWKEQLEKGCMEELAPGRRGGSAGSEPQAMGEEVQRLWLEGGQDGSPGRLDGGRKSLAFVPRRWEAPGVLRQGMDCCWVAG